MTVTSGLHAQAERTKKAINIIIIKIPTERREPHPVEAQTEVPSLEGGTWFELKIPRGDTNGVREDEVTVTSGLHRGQS